MNFRQKLERERAGNILFPQMRLGIFCHYTPEEQAELDKIKREAELSAARVKELEEKLKTNPPAPNPNPPNPQNPPAPTLDELIAKAKKEAEEKARMQTETQRLESAVNFNFTVEQTVKENVDVVGEDIAKIVELAKQRAYPSALEKADEMRATILNAFFAKQNNVDALLTDKFKKRATDYLALTQVKRNELSGEYWELFDLALENLKREKKQAELIKGERGIETNDFQKKYKERLTEKTINCFNPLKSASGVIIALPHLAKAIP